MTRRKNFSILELLMIVILTYSIMPVVSRVFSSYITTYSYMALIVVTVFSIVFLQGQNFLAQILVIAVPLLFFEILVFLVTNPSIVLWGYGVLIEILPIFVGLFIVKIENYKNIKIFAIVMFLAFAVTTVTTIIGLQTYPDAARYLATVGDASEEDAVLYGFLNIGGYSFVYTSVLLYPLAIYAYKRGKINLVVLIVFAAAELTLIISSGYTTAFLLWMCTTVFVFFGKNLKAIHLIIVAIVALIGVILVFNLVSDLLVLIADNIDNDTIAERLRDVAGGREGLETSEDNRLGLWLMSLNSFLQNPIFGNLTYEGGGHSFILDSLAEYGLVGGILLATVYVYAFKKFFAPYKNAQGYGYVVWTFVQTLILSTVNTGMWLYVLCLYAPIVLAYINNGEKNCEGTLDRKLGFAENSVGL